MKIRKADKKHRFFSVFDTETGFYFRTGVIGKDGKDTGIDPFMTSFPELIDIGIMGHCIHGSSGLCVQSGVQCYQSGLTINQPNMTLDNFKKIIDECKGKVYQVALGGRGDVNKHEDFEAILKYCRDNNIVPNYTTSGLDLTDEEVRITKEYCGAVAVSWYRHPHTLSAIDKFVKAGVKTNIHYVLSNHSIGEALDRLRKHSFPEGINAVIFLLHKPVGLGTQDGVLKPDSARLKYFFDAIESEKYDFKIGFDSCTVPGLVNYTSKLIKESFDTCEGARWSMYISSDMKALPCSFDQDHRWAVDISKATIQEAWDSPQFESFRSHFRNSCPDCGEQAGCMGGCPIKSEVVLCQRKEKALDEVKA